MTNRNPRPRWIAAVLVVLALLALVAWWRGPHALHERDMQSMRMPTAHAPQVDTPEPGIKHPRSSKQTAAGIANHDSGNTSAVQACNRDYRAAIRDYRDRLAPARNADEAVDRLMLDLIVAQGERKGAFGAYGRELRLARQRWPDDLELSWLALDHCGNGCDQDAEVRHLLTVDPDNAAAWMVAMAIAHSDRDEKGFAYALQRAANAKIYDSRMGVVFLHARTLLARVPLPDSCHDPETLASLRQEVGREPIDDDVKDITAFAMEAAVATSGVQGLSRCTSRPATPPLPATQRKQCIALLSRVAQGDTLLEQQAATSWLLGLETDRARLVQLRERYRRLQWLQKVTLGNPTPQHYATRVWSQGEVATMQALAIERGLWPPPPDWLPDDARSRALITGEPPPPN